MGGEKKGGEGKEGRTTPEQKFWLPCAVVHNLMNGNVKLMYELMTYESYQVIQLLQFFTAPVSMMPGSLPLDHTSVIMC